MPSVGPLRRGREAEGVGARSIFAMIAFFGAGK